MGKRLGIKWKEKVAVDAVLRSGTASYFHEVSKRLGLCEDTISADSLLDVKNSHLTGCE